MEKRLIEFVRQNRFLYDKTHKSYKNTELRDEKYEELGAKLKVPAKRLKDRWRTLRDKYNWEKKRPPPKIGAKCPKKWKWMDLMSFLHDDQSEDLISYSDFNMKSEEFTISSYTEVEPSETSVSFDIEPSTPFSEKLSCSYNKNTNECSTDALVLDKPREYKELMELMKKSCKQQSSKSTAADLYFQMMAEQVKDMNLPPEQFLKLQIELQKILLNFQIIKNRNT